MTGTRPIHTVFRPWNLLLITVLQCLVLLHLGDYNYLFYQPIKTICLLVSTLLIAGAGYVINDYFDRKIDLINKPSKVIVGTSLSRRRAMATHLTLSFAGLVLASRINMRTFLLALGCAILLYFYSATFKKKFLTGNMVIALLSMASVYICQCYIGNLNDEKVYAYTFFAGFSTLLREIVKDLEDARGDALFESNSLALSLGLRRTKNILYLASALFIGAVVYYPLWISDRITDDFSSPMLYASVLWIGVAFPTLFFLLKLYQADKQSDFAFLSQLLKIIMLVGIFSIMLS